MRNPKLSIKLMARHVRWWWPPAAIDRYAVCGAKGECAFYFDLRLGPVLIQYEHEYTDHRFS